MVGEGLFFSELQRESNSRSATKSTVFATSLTPPARRSRRNTIVGYIAWLNVEFQAGD